MGEGVVPTMASPAKKSPARGPGPLSALNRFTSLPIALDLLQRKEITLLSPETWEDRNDAYYLERYRDERRLRSILAICFSVRKETFHHWRVFSYGSSGVCIEFDKDKLLKAIPGSEGFRHGPAYYRLISQLQKKKPALEDWPFLKRKPFEDEGEYRIIFESKTESMRAKRVTIELSSIRKVILSPWLPESVAASVIDIIKTIDGCSKLSVSRSSLIDNAGWRAIID
jgi:hypothetical protein